MSKIAMDLLQKYTKIHNSLSWKMGEATDSFSSLLGWIDWQTEWIKRMEGKTSYPLTKFSHASIAISHSLVSHFFISICHIREKTNSKMNLYCCYEKATADSLLSKEQLERAEQLMASTLDIFKKVKIVRGKVVAHLNTDDSPFEILKQSGVTRDDILRYLNECNELFAILGQPIKKNNTAHKSFEYKNELYDQMFELHSILNPVE